MAERVDYYILSKSGDVSQLIYPDVHSAGGLVRLVQRWFELLDSEARVTGMPGEEVAGLPAQPTFTAVGAMSIASAAAETRPLG